MELGWVIEVALWAVASSVSVVAALRLEQQELVVLRPAVAHQVIFGGHILWLLPCLRIAGGLQHMLERIAF